MKVVFQMRIQIIQRAGGKYTMWIVLQVRIQIIPRGWGNYTMWLVAGSRSLPGVGGSYNTINELLGFNIFHSFGCYR